MMVDLLSTFINIIGVKFTKIKWILGRKNLTAKCILDVMVSFKN